MKIKLLFLFAFLSIGLSGQMAKISGTISDKTGAPVPLANIHFPGLNTGVSADLDGAFSINDIPLGKHRIVISSIGYISYDQILNLTAPIVTLNVTLEAISQELEAVEISDGHRETSVYNHLKSIEGVAIYAAKKNEVIDLQNVTANLSSNSARQVFARVPGVNVWESDCAGLQLGIGARGLSPDRSANFNTRQNGYDMAADALGYPESYYAPPMQAIDRIEIVRGAASLQYGTQFGGMINLKLKKGNPDKILSGKTMNTYNSVGYFNTYNELGGQYKKLNYYGFINYRGGNCNCPNTDFNANTNYIRLGYTFSDRFQLSAEYTNMSYLAQQSGGLTDFQFEEDPYQSFRERNWFKVKWNLAAVILDYKISEQTILNSRTFSLLSTRQALGFLSPPNRLDLQPYVNRDLLVDNYKNIGNETRLLHRYRLNSLPSAFLVGVRLYRGFTEKTQGYGSKGSNADFSFHSDSLRLKSDYDFPSYNFAAFAENIFTISDRLSITPGIRYEYIRTTADGFYDSSVRIPNTGEIVIDSVTYEERDRRRSLLLGGIGIGFKLTPNLELYTNFSQNYRAITFNDFRVVSSSARVDPNLKDEKGFNFDLGVRGNINSIFTLDGGVFWLSYTDRIGSVQKFAVDEFFGERVVVLTTNVADADIIGAETYLETDVLKLFKLTPANFDFTHFVNLAYTHARYNNSREKSIEGNYVEAVPEWNLKTGLNGRYGKWKASLLFTYISRQYSEATNADLSPTGVYGLIPSYWVMDFSMTYASGHFSAEGGVNNFTNNKYFTRRAVGYPGPGIIPSSSLNFYIGVGFSF